MFERLMSMFGYHQEVIDKIVNIKSQDLDSLVSYLLDKIQTNKADYQTLYDVISYMGEISIGYIHEYWYIYDQLYQHSKVKPESCDRKYIIEILFAKKYNIKIEWPNYYDDELEDWEKGYENCHYMSFDGVLNYYESDPIMKCIIHDDIKSLKKIIDLNPDFDLNQQLYEKSLIENCCFCGSVECFKFMRSNGIEINKKCLDYSIDGRNGTIINECLQQFKPDNDTMWEVIETHNFEMAVSFEQKYGLTIDVRDVSCKFDSRLFFYLMSKATNYDDFLICCFAFKIHELFNFIISLGANINAKDKYGSTPLHKAAYYNNCEAITKLVELGANIEAQGDFGKTPLHQAAAQNSVEAIAKLAELGANINAKDVICSTPLHNAAFFNNVEAVTKLVELGANIETKNYIGITPFGEALSNHNSETVKKLGELGANTKLLDMIEMDEDGDCISDGVVLMSFFDLLNSA